MKVIEPYRLFVMIIISVVIIAGVLAMSSHRIKSEGTSDKLISTSGQFEWKIPDQIPHSLEGELIHYGKDLISNTSIYFGPKGRVASITNGMNCQNCHLDAGTRSWGNNYSGVYSTYPRFRERSGTSENIYKRVNDCIERSLNGQTIDTNSREMQAVYAYMKWLGTNVPREVKPTGAGIKDLPFLDRSADPQKGSIVFKNSCQRCHGVNGEGVQNPMNGSFIYPPLWGEKSYTTAAGLFRISRFAGLVRYNMPFDAPHNSPSLTDEQAWDVAAFVNSQPRPVKIFEQDWPNIAGKPFDHPFGPYADDFSEKQHKYGPYKPIVDAAKELKTLAGTK